MPAKTFNFPVKTTNFVERAALRDKIKQELNDQEKVIVNGLEGSGKTCLVTELSHKLLNEDKIYIAAVYVNCIVNADIDELIARQTGSMEIKLPTDNKETRTVNLADPLINENEKILYVFDNVDNSENFINQLPQYVTSQRYIIISKRACNDNGLQSDAAIPNPVIVGAFTSEEASEYLKKRLRAKGIVSIQDKKLQYFSSFAFNYPLWIRELLADRDSPVKYIFEHFMSEELENDFTIKLMDVDLDEKFALIDRKTLLQTNVNYDSPDYQPKTSTEKAMTLAYINYPSANEGLKLQLHKLLSYLSLLYSKNIPYTLLERLIPDRVILNKFIDYLQENGLISRADLISQAEAIPRMYNISPLFQFIWRDNLADEQQKILTKDILIAISPLIEEAVQASSKTAIHHAYALHSEVLAYHGKKSKVDNLNLAVINSKIGKYHSDSLSLTKAIEFYKSAKLYYEKWIQQRRIDLETFIAADLDDNQKKFLFDYANCLNNLSEIQINMWDDVDRLPLIINLTIAKTVLEKLPPDNDNNLLLKVKANIARTHRKNSKYTDAKNAYLEIADDSYFIIDAKIYAVLTENLNSENVRLLKIYTDTLIKLHKIEDQQTRTNACRELEFEYIRIKNEDISEISIKNFQSFCKSVKERYLPRHVNMSTIKKISHYEKLAHYRFAILKLYLKIHHLSEADYDCLAKICRQAAKACKTYFANLKLEDVSTEEQPSLVNLDTAKIFYQVSQVALELYNKRKNHITHTINVQDEDKINYLLCKDKYGKTFLSSAFQMCNLGIVTHRTLNLSPKHPYSEKMVKLQDDIFYQVGVENISSKLNWSAENHKVDGDKAKLFDKQKRAYDKCNKESNEGQNLRLSLGNLAIMLGRYKLAIQFFSKHLAYDKQKSTIDIEVLKKLGCAYYCDKEYDKAVATFTQVLKYFPTDFNSIKWLTAAKEKVAENDEPRSRQTNDGTPLSQFVKGFKEEFVRKVEEHRNRLDGKDKREQNKSLKMFSALAKYLPDLNIAAPGIPVGVALHLGDATQQTLQQAISIKAAQQDTENFYVTNLSKELIKQFSDALLSDTAKLMDAVHNIACAVADGLPNILNNVYDIKYMAAAGGGIAQRIIYHFANNQNDINMPLDDQISLAVFEGKCDDIDLFKPGEIRPYLLDNIIRRSGLITPTGQVYCRSHSHVRPSHSPPFFKGLGDKLSPRANDQRDKYGYRIGPLLHQMVPSFKPVSETEIFEKTRLNSTMVKAAHVSILCI